MEGDQIEISKKKILLINPNFRWKNSMDNILWHYIPYGLCLIAAMLEKEHDVEILDAYADNLSEKEFIQMIVEKKPCIVGITALMDYFGETAHAVARMIKEVDRSIVTVIGGVYATTNIEKAIQDVNIDYLIAGEGEYAFRYLVEQVFSSGQVDKAGIYYRMNGELFGAGRTENIEDLDVLPLPAYHLLDFRKYSTNASRSSVDGPYYLPYARLFTSRGCPFHCCFCQVNYICGGGFRARSAANVLAEIDWLISNYQIKSIIFDDDNFFTDRERAKKIMEGLIGKNIEWKMIATAAFLLDDELIELMKLSGCQYMDLAIESGTYRILKEVIHKPINFDKVRQVIGKAKKEGIFVSANFIIGFPTETWDEIRETLKFAEDIGVDYAKISNAVPLPHTEMYNVAKELDCLVPNYDSENVDWKTGMMQSEEFTSNELTILRAYEWDRINFTDAVKRKKTAEMMDISEEELNIIRKRTREVVQNLIRQVNS